MASKQLVQAKANPETANVSAPAHAAAKRSAAGPIGSGRLGSGHAAAGSGGVASGYSFGSIPLFAAGAFNDGGAPIDAGLESAAGGGRDAGATADAGTPSDAGARGPGGPGDAGARDGGGAATGGGGTPPAACTITSKTGVHAPDLTPDSRTTIGVCETVIFEAGGQIVDWSASNGWPSSRARTARYEWAAPEMPGPSTITATVPVTGQTCTIDMDVIAPKTVHMSNPVNVPPPLAPGEVGKQAQVIATVGPRNVNFGWVSLLEDPGPATNVTGYFGRFPLASLRHVPDPNFKRLLFNNTLFDTIGVQVGLPPPFSQGTWDWDIPTRYACSNSTGGGHIFLHVFERFRMTAAGVFTVSKGGLTI